MNPKNETFGQNRCGLELFALICVEEPENDMTIRLYDTSTRMRMQFFVRLLVRCGS